MIYMTIFALTGANGHLGRLVLENLLNQVPAAQILATTRRPDLLGEVAARGVTVRFADFNDPSSLPAAFSGATRLLIISTGDYKEIYSGQRLIQHKEAISAAVRAGIQHIMYTSCPNATNEGAVNLTVADPITVDHRQTEAALAESGTAWAALRNNIYMGGVSYFFNALRVGDEFLIPEGCSAKPCWVTHEDCARTAASVLTGRFPAFGAVDVTGPEALGLADLAQRWSDLHECKLAVRYLPGKEVIKRLAKNGMPLQSAKGLVENISFMMQLSAVPVSDVVERATGTRPASVDGVLSAL
jgi:NAD(P)H dehydrogenase (quinone)